MNWTEIWGWINERYVAITATGAGGLLFIKTFILDKISFAKKAETFNVFESKVVALNETTDVKVELIYEKFELVQAKLDAQIKLNTSLIEQNEQFKNLMVQTLSTANVPLVSKEKFYGGLTEVFPNVNAKVSEAFKQTLDFQNAIKNTQEKVSSAVIDAVSKV